MLGLGEVVWVTVRDHNDRLPAALREGVAVPQHLACTPQGRCQLCLTRFILHGVDTTPQQLGIANYLRDDGEVVMEAYHAHVHRRHVQLADDMPQEVGRLGEPVFADRYAGVNAEDKVQRVLSPGHQLHGELGIRLHLPVAQAGLRLRQRQGLRVGRHASSDALSKPHVLQLFLHSHTVPGNTPRILDGRAAALPAPCEGVALLPARDHDLLTTHLVQVDSLVVLVQVDVALRPADLQRDLDDTAEHVDRRSRKVRVATQREDVLLYRSRRELVNRVEPLVPHRHEHEEDALVFEGLHLSLCLEWVVRVPVGDNDHDPPALRGGQAAGPQEFRGLPQRRSHHRLAGLELHGVQAPVQRTAVCRQARDDLEGVVVADHSDLDRWHVQGANDVVEEFNRLLEVLCPNRHA
mmetsp:Transcript_100712/g.260160  ORF Transcript_100712/g.260160 Transcript_100712/m.260160 type:complete len:408 (-) Transcript_100712:1191-2414(-)